MTRFLAAIEISLRGAYLQRLSPLPERSRRLGVAVRHPFDEVAPKASGMS